MDKLEKFILENREGFDSFEPSPAVWEKLDARFERNSRRPVIIRRIAVAASVALIAGISFIAGIYFATPGKNNTILAAQEREKLPALKLKENPKEVIRTDIVPEQHPDASVNPSMTGSANKNEKIFYGETDAYYRQTMLEQRRQIAILSGNNPGILRSVNEEFLSLDSTIKVLASDLGDNVNNVEVMEAIVQNYRMRIEMLNMMIQQLKETSYENDKTLEL